MAKPEQIVASLEKLYAKRTALDKQIAGKEKELLVEAKNAIKPAKLAVKKAPAKKPGRKPRTPKV
jgi:hypothetical protein